MFRDLPTSMPFLFVCQLMAYGGKLKYTIYFEAREETGLSTYKPQVIIRGGTPSHARLIVRHVAAPLIGQLTRHEIEMTEVKLSVSWCKDANGLCSVSSKWLVFLLTERMEILWRRSSNQQNCEPQRLHGRTVRYPLHSHQGHLWKYHATKQVSHERKYPG